MAENSGISWTNHTFNPWIGCARISPACDGCYAAGLMGAAGRFGPARVVWGGPGKGEGTRDRTAPSTWAKVRTWNRQAAAAPGQTFVFCASLADVFDNAVPAEWRRDLFDLIRETPNLTWLLLTKRPQMIVKLFAETLPPGHEMRRHLLAGSWPRNAAIGTTIEDRKRLCMNAPHLAYAAATLDPAFTFWSCEPLLEDLGDLSKIDTMAFRGAEVFDALTGQTSGMFGEPAGRAPKVDWIITGGETDQKLEDGTIHQARQEDPDWYRSIRDQCRAAGVTYHHKQMMRGGPIPADLQIQERPLVRR